MNIRGSAAFVLGILLSLGAGAAVAQRVVVLEFQNDRGGQLRMQVVRQLLADREVELVPLKDFQRLAARRGFVGARGNTPAAVAAVAPDLPFVAAVTGRVAKGFGVQIYDAQGEELWSRNIPLQKRRLSPLNTRRLAAAIAAAARIKPKEQDPVLEPDPEPEPEPELRPDEPQERPIRPPDRPTWPRPSLTDEDVEPTRPRVRRRVAPKLVTLQLGGLTIWRSYCSRPGVTSCAQFDALPLDQRPGLSTVNFSPQKPYLGARLGLEFFPMASFDNPLNGLGLSAAFSRGFSRTRVTIQSQGGEPQPGRDVNSFDDSWEAMGLWRYYFGYGDRREPLVGYVGVRGGLASRSFEVDPDAQVPLPGSHRRYPMAALDASFPAAAFARVEASFALLLSPRPSVEEIAPYGREASSTGWMAEAGLAGDLWGPLGYIVRFRFSRFKDTFGGQGAQWPAGGVAEESYADLFWGVTAGF